MSEEKIFYIYSISTWNSNDSYNEEWSIGIPKNTDYYKSLHIDEWVRDSYWKVK